MSFSFLVSDLLCILQNFVIFDIKFLSMFVSISLYLVSSFKISWIFVLLYVLYKMTLSLPLSASFIIMFSFSCILLRLVFVFVRGYYLLLFFLLGWYSIISRRMCLVHYYSFCRGKIWFYLLRRSHLYLLYFWIFLLV